MLNNELVILRSGKSGFYCTRKIIVNFSQFTFFWIGRAITQKQCVRSLLRKIENHNKKRYIFTNLDFISEKMRQT